jgi:hypothetical protein
MDIISHHKIIAEGKYPLARDLYIVNCQGYSGLGMGFAHLLLEMLDKE